jgi:hypothetical protein
MGLHDDLHVELVLEAISGMPALRASLIARNRVYRPA